MIAIQREAKRVEKAQRSAESKVEKDKIVAEAEKLAQGNDWRNGANRLRDLLDQWKALPRLDKATDDALWKRFSGARTTYTRRRKAHFAEEHEKPRRRPGDQGAAGHRGRVAVHLDRVGPDRRPLPRPDARLEGRRPGAARHRRRALEALPWRAGRLLRRPRRRQRRARQGVRRQRRVKEEILVEAEKLVPVTDLDAAKKAFRDLADRWDAAGKVPRERMKDLEARMRKVEQAIRSVEDDQWKRSDPEKSARADDIVSKLEAGIADEQAKLDKAKAAGDDKRVKQLEDSLANKQAFLDMARKASEEFS